MNFKMFLEILQPMVYYMWLIHWMTVRGHWFRNKQLQNLGLFVVANMNPNLVSFYYSITKNFLKFFVINNIFLILFFINSIPPGSIGEIKQWLTYLLLQMFSFNWRTIILKRLNFILVSLFCFIIQISYICSPNWCETNIQLYCYSRTPEQYQFPWGASWNTIITSSLFTFSILTISSVIASASLSFSLCVLPLYISTVTIGIISN